MTDAEPTNAKHWHALTAEKALSTLNSSAHGLSSEEANRRLAQYGHNTIRGAERVRPWLIFLHQFTSPLIYILLAAMVITLAIGEYADSIVIALVLTINATIGFIQEYRAENAMQALMKMVTPKATARRDGERCEVDSIELVPGDIILLESGDLVPADARIIDESQLRVDDSILTGESEAVGKTKNPIEGADEVPVADRKNLVFMGTSIASGRARALVIATGANTQIGQIAGEMRETERAWTPLQRRMHKFGHLVSVIILVASTIAFVVGLSQGIPAADMFLTAVAIAVAAIPEGLPIVMTVALAVAVRRMAKQNAIIRRLPAVETLGSCSIIVSDKTGTLTENRMTVQAAWAADESFTFTGTGLNIHGDVQRHAETVQIEEDTPLYRTLLAGMLANESDLRRHHDQGAAEKGEMIPHGDPTEVALLVAAAKAGLSREDLIDAYPQIGEVPFESDRQFSATIHRKRDANGSEVVLLKGAPERVLDMCDSIMAADGPRPIDHEKDRQRILDAAHRMANEGLRLLAMAEGNAAEAVESTHRAEPRGLTFLGLVGMMDPPRKEVPEAIRKCHDAGMRVIMCTGDHASTARAIAAKIGLHRHHDEHERPEAITGAQMLEMSDEELRSKLKDAVVFARVSPHQKLRIVNLLRELDEVVAVTGDGVNDAPALKSAHIGCAMGISGTDVAKEASELVLADDNFATIYAAVEGGRTVFSNIRKATDFLLSTSVGVVLAIFGCFVLAAFGIVVLEDESIPLLLVPAQILWLNVVTAGTQDVSLAFEPGEKHQYTRPPRDPEEGLLNRTMLERTVLVGILLAIVALIMFTWELNRTGDLAYAQCSTLTAMVIFKLLHVGACRSDVLSIFQKNFFSNRVLFIAASASLVAHLGAMHFGPTQELLRLQPLQPDSWVAIIIGAPFALVLVEVHKLLRRQ